MKIPPAPESRRALVSTVFSFLLVLHRIGRDRFIDCNPTLATSTEEMVSDVDVGTGRLIKNPHSLIFACRFLVRFC